MKDFLYEFKSKNIDSDNINRSYNFSSITVNGKEYNIGGNINLFNKPDLLNELQLNSFEINDEELLLRHYLSYGNNTFNKIYGDFIFFIHDLYNNKFIAIKDPTSHLKLYYLFNNNSCIVSDNLYAILKRSDIELNEDKLIKDIANIGFLSNETYYKNIFFLRKGESIIIQGDNKPHLNRYYTIPLKTIKYKNNKDYYENFDILLNKAIRNRIKKPEEVGLMLSGGMDSTTIAYKLAVLFPDKTINTYTHAPKYKTDNNLRLSDESELVKEMLEKFKNLNGKILRSENVSVIKAIEECLEMHPEPIHGANNAYWILDIVNELKKDNKKYLITASSGNATISWPTFGFYNRYYNLNITFAQKIKRQLRFFSLYEKYYLKKYFNNQILNNISDSSYNDYTKKLAMNLIHTIDFNLFNKNNFRETLLLSEFVNPLLSLKDIEVIDPTSDKLLVEYLFNIPEKHYVSWSNRFILKYLKNRIPNSIIDNKKIGLQSSDIMNRLKEEKIILEKSIICLKNSELVNKYFYQKNENIHKTILRNLQKALFLYKIEREITHE